MEFFLPQDVLIEFFLRLETFYQRHVAALVCKEWRQACLIMERTFSRQARYGHFRFERSLLSRNVVVTCQGAHGPTALTVSEPQSSRQFTYLSFMHMNGQLGHPWTWVHEDLWDSKDSLGHQWILATRKSEEFDFVLTLERRKIKDTITYIVAVDGTEIVCRDLDSSRTLSVSELVVEMIRIALTDPRGLQEPWRHDKSKALVDNYPYGMLERLHSHWEPWLGIRKDDDVHACKVQRSF